MWFTLVKKFWKEIILIGIILVLLVLLSVKNSVIAKNELHIVNLTFAVEHYKGEVNKCRGVLQDQNDKIETAAQASYLKLEELKNLNKELVKLDQSNKKVINALKNQPLSGTCEDVSKYLKNSIKELQWSN